jgi:NADH-quinone oxidoreductase subunit L
MVGAVAQHGDGAGANSVLAPGEALSEIPSGASLMVFVPLLALASCALCGVCAALRVKSKLPAWITVACLAGAFLLTAKTYMDAGTVPHVAHAWDWITFQYGTTLGETFTANFSFYIDSLTLLWMLFVTGLATLIALYASEYMGHDVGQGYNRFFAAFSLLCSRWPAW